MVNSVDVQMRERIAAARNKFEGRHDAMPRRPEGVDSIPLSSGQSRLWYMSQVEPDSAVYNLVEANRLTGKLNVDALNFALNKVVERHEILRTDLRIVDGAPVQYVSPILNYELDVRDFQQKTEDALRADIADLVLKPFDLSAAPLFRWVLYVLGPSEHVLLLVMHHSVVDGISVARMLREAGVFYRSFLGGNADGLDSIDIQYADYAFWQRDWLDGNDAKSQLRFWVDQHGGSDNPLELPTDFLRPSEQSYMGDAVRLRIPQQELESFAVALKSQKSSMFMGLMALVSALMHRYSSQEAINIGVPSSGRGHADIENTIGYFANTLVFHVPVDASQSFLTHLGNVREMCITSLKNQDIPFDQVVNAINPPRDVSRTPLYQVLLGYQDKRQREVDFGDIAVEPYETDIKVSRTDLTFWVEQDGGGLSIVLEYCKALFEASTAERMLAQLHTMILAVGADLDAPIFRIPLLAADERAVQNAQNDTKCRFDEDNALTLISKAIARYPDDTALVCGDETMTYRQLDAASDAVCAALRQAEAGVGSIIGIHMSRTPNVVAAMLGVWKAGCAYMPLDPEFPRLRLQYMMEKSGAEHVLEDAVTRTDSLDSRHVIDIDRVLGNIEGQPKYVDDEVRSGDALAYVIFTSGSTGNPKGVMVSHSAVANFLQSMAIRPGFTAKNRLLAVTTLSFDISVLELLLPLTVGGSLVIASSSESADVVELASLLQRFDVDTMQATPATWKLLMSENWTPPVGEFRALCGGEAMPASLAAQLVDAGCELWNMYGPTETTIWSTCCRIEDPERAVPLGSPIDNTQCYVVDAYGQLCPIGVPGELCIGGSGLANGYIGDAELTRDRFVEFDDLQPGRSVLAYRTGDVVVRTRSGELLYKGRSDDQVKLRGFRIETGDVESSLLAIEAIEEAAVLVKVFGESDSRLLAFVRFGPGSRPSTTELRRQLGDSLPKYMIPQQFIPVESMPLTANGKIDKKALAESGGREQATSRFIAPNTDAERRVSEIWCEALQVDAVSVDKCFFDVGGHSLLSIRVIQEMERAFGYRVGPREMMLNTLQQIAAVLDSHENGRIPVTPEAHSPAPSALSRISRLLFGR